MVFSRQFRFLPRCTLRILPVEKILISEDGTVNEQYAYQVVSQPDVYRLESGILTRIASESKGKRCWCKAMVGTSSIADWPSWTFVSERAKNPVYRAKLSQRASFAHALSVPSQVSPSPKLRRYSTDMSNQLVLQNGPPGCLGYRHSLAWLGNCEDLKPCRSQVFLGDTSVLTPFTNPHDTPADQRRKI